MSNILLFIVNFVFLLYFYQNLNGLKRLSLLIALLCFGLTCTAQNFYLKIAGSSERENIRIDSIGYNPNQVNAKSAAEEVSRFSAKLDQLGYIENEMIENSKSNDSTFFFRFSLGNKTDWIHICIGSPSELKTLGILDPKKDTLILPLSATEAFLKQTLNTLETKGYALARLKLIHFTKNKGHLHADLQLQTGIQRQLNAIVINGYDQFPQGHKKNIERMYRNKTFNQDNLNKMYNDFEKFRFVNQTKYPEILFTQDTTKIYVYLEKSKPNRFDGFIGFANDEEKKKLTFNGYLDVLLVNFVNTGEEFTLYWKSDGKEQKTFNTGIELPYLFKSPFGLKASLNIFKQDSTFQNTRTALDIGYFFNYNARLYLGYQATESSDIQNQNNFSISDYKNTFFTTNFEFFEFKNDDFLFPEKTKINIKLGLGSRKSNVVSNSQIFADIQLQHSVYLNEKNIFNLKSQNFYLKSDTYIVNELHRFGGINSIRGFNENSLQAHLFTSLLTEYRYILAPNIYIHSLIDYGYFKDNTSNSEGGLLGLGFGFGLLTKNGLLNLIYANGSTKDQSIELANSIVHLSFKTSF